MSNQIQNPNSKKRIFIFISLLMILAMAGFFRFWHLDIIPPGVYPDEAMNGMNALEANKTHHYQVFYPENNGREGLEMNLTALIFKLTPPTAWSLRLTNAILGTLTILGVYLLTKELFRQTSASTPFKKPRVFSQTECLALTAAFLLAIGFWHVNFSRMAFRALITPFLMVFSFYFLWLYFRRGKIPSLIISAIFFGLGFHTYIAFRVAVFLLIIAWLPALISLWCSRGHRHEPRLMPLKKWRHLLLYLIVVAVVFAPLGIYFFQHPEQIMGRATEVAIWKSESPIKNLIISVAKTLGMFNIRGDYNWRHNFSGRPQLLWPVGIFFLIGLIYLVRNIWLTYPRRHEAPSRIYKKQKPILSFHNSIFLLSWFILLLLPALLTAEGLPHALRALGVIPAVFILASLGLITPYFWFQEKLNLYTEKIQDSDLKLKRQIKRIKVFLTVLIVLILIVLAVFEYQKYFIDWANQPKVAWAFTQDFVAMGDYLNSLPTRIQRFVIVNQDGVLVNGIPMPAQTIKFVTYGHAPATYLLPDQIDQIQVTQEKKVNAVIILMAEDENIVKQIQQNYPQNITGTHYGEFTFISI